MSRYYRLLLPVLFVLFYTAALAQDSIVYTYAWKVTSKKTAEREYEISFSTAGKSGVQLYAPGQDIGGVASTTLVFPDSGISILQPLRISSGNTVEFVSALFENKVVSVIEGPAEWKTRIRFRDTVPGTLQGNLTYFYGSKSDPNEFNQDPALAFNVTLEGGMKTGPIKVASIDIDNPAAPCGDDGTTHKSLFTIFLLGLLGGIIALVTPCVFPMIPVTVTFFTKKSADRRKGVSNALLYGFFIFLIYVLITLPFHVAGKAISPEIFNNISTNVWLNLLFFAIFVAFALSFFGLYEIGLPSGLANKADSKSGLGNIGGIFFMATTLAIVSFSCTGPLLGTLLVGVADQGAWPLTVGAAGFGIALGLPFALFAMFPNWLQSLPKSGGWMTDVKVVLGFLELALAIKFLSNADLVKQWGLLKREIFIGLWVLIGAFVVLYLLGLIRIAHSTRVKKFGPLRIAFILLFGAAAIYLVPGLWNARLRLISGFPPPRNYSLFPPERKALFEPIHNDYTGALARAKAEHKPVLIDFTGWACVNCRRMEENIWPDKIVDSLMRNEFIVVSLYVDEKNNLPIHEQTVERLSNQEEKSIVSVGDKWSTFQTENFKATSQPQYAIISPDQVLLTKTKYYTPDAEEFIDWLECGLEAYRGDKEPGTRIQEPPKNR
ncbi:MAG: thioredoxin family protein [Sphingobacteriales bacterium]|nr:thioredoxin family protein [Sphingobacteriales bacterium]